MMGSKLVTVDEETLGIRSNKKLLSAVLMVVFPLGIIFSFIFDKRAFLLLLLPLSELLVRDLAL